jgi:V8-like Glu-specific endopeptidase
MDAQNAIEQTTRRAGRQYTRKRDTEEFKRQIKNWREVETPERVMNRLDSLGLHREAVKVAAAVVSGETADTLNPLERIIGASQLISSIFLPLGAARTRAVGRIITESGRGFGTGFLVSPRLLMTNNHVLDSASMAGRCRVQFDFVKAIDGNIGVTEIYRLVPGEFFLTAEATDALNLDYTIVAVEAVNAEGKEVSRRGFIPLIAASGKLTLGDLANIIQHPGGEAQQLALRDSKVVTPLENFIRYEADTQPGSSGSPVFNDLWQLAALHHSGVPEEARPGVYRLVDGGEWDTRLPLSHEDQLRMAARVKWIANEGVRVSSIVRDVEARLQGDPVKLAMFQEAVRDGATPPSPDEVARAIAEPQRSSGVAVSADNTATWTIPLRVTVQLGPDLQVSLGHGGAVPGRTTPAVALPLSPAVPTGTPADTDAATASARATLAGRPEILEVRSGFLWKDSEMTDTEAVVVVLDPNAPLGAGDPHDTLKIPREIDGVPVDVTVGGATAVFRAMERRGDLLSESLPLADLLQERVPEIGYKAPVNVVLDEVELPMEVIAHVSPDDGWPVLEEFLDRTTSTITLGMFDLTAPQIVDKLKELAARPAFKMNLAIQRGMAGGLGGEKKDDIPEDDVIDELESIMGNRFRQAFVDVSGDDRTFASSYHIKVAVRDHEEFWLSSGNLQTSNQPDASPAADEEKTFSPLRRFNREWHVIVRNKKLATMFEKFLLHDLKTAEANPAEKPKPSDEIVLPLIAPDPQFLEADKKPQYVERKTFPQQNTSPVRIQPLLTPDNFLENVIPIVKSAKKTLFIQNQSLSLLQPLDKNEDDFLELFEAILARQKAGVDVRMIFRVIPVDEDGARATKDALVKFGFKKKNIFVQENCHTKGVIVDSRVVIVGSHNWTNQGTVANRDASLIIHHEEIAKYYEQVFLFDWDTLTRNPKPPKPKKTPGGDESVPAGPVATIRISAEALVPGD